MRLQNRSILITGAAQGLGEAIAMRLAMEGSDVCLVDIGLDKARAAADKIAFGSERIRRWFHREWTPVSL